METISYSTIDRAARQWPSGPWDGEPDKVQWPDAATKLPCLAVRHPLSGHWCGYVGVDKRHPWHGRAYDEVFPAPEVHGGLTFSRDCDHNEEGESTGVCHVPASGEPDHVWWFGFDCAHYLDFSPRDALYSQSRGYPFTKTNDQIYRTLAFVRAECANLARQLSAVNGND